jgi:hypothetical protein
MGRILKTAGFYLLLGPPVGTVVLFLLMALTQNEGSSSIGGLEATQNVLGALAFALPFSYLFGGSQALLTGLAAALWEKWRGRTPVVVPLLVSAVMWLGSSAVLATDAAGIGSGVGLIMLAVHLCSAAACWWLLRKIRKEDGAA